MIRPLLLALAILLPLAGCNAKRALSADGRPKVKVAWIGLVCEAPIFVAYEKGFFTEQGLDVELVKTDWDSMQSGMSFGRFDATHTLVTYLLKPIEQGLNVKITGGIHKGCLRLQAGVKTNIRSVEDLRGKRVAVSTMGSPPMIFANRVFADHGMDAAKDVEWVVFPAAETGLALDKGQVDAVADSEPIGSLLLADGKVRTITDQSLDAPYRDEFCCVAVVSGKLAATEPETAAKVTRALMKGAKWVGANPQAAAALSVEKKYLASNVQLNAAALSQLRYAPAVASCRAGIDQQTRVMKSAGMLNRSTDPADLARRAWQSLDGVTDSWIESVTVEQVAGGGPPPTDPLAIAAALGGRKPCCNKCCVGE